MSEMRKRRDAAVEMLSRLRALRGEVEMLSRKIAEMEMAQGGGAGRISGMPRVRRRYDGVEELQGQIDEMTLRLERRRMQCMEELGEIYRFLDDVEDSQMRQILCYRYVDGMLWRQIAVKMGLSGEQIPRKRHDAFLGGSGWRYHFHEKNC